MVAWSHDHSPCYDMVASVSPAALYALMCCLILRTRFSTVGCIIINIKTLLKVLLVFRLFCLVNKYLYSKHRLVSSASATDNTTDTYSYKFPCQKV